MNITKAILFTLGASAALLSSSCSDDKTYAELLADEGCARACWRALTPGGVVAANVVTPAGDATFLRDLCCAFEAVFGQVELLPCEDDAWGADDNYLMVAWR